MNLKYYTVKADHNVYYLKKENGGGCLIKLAKLIIFGEY